MGHQIGTGRPDGLMASTGGLMAPGAGGSSTPTQRATPWPPPPAGTDRRPLPGSLPIGLPVLETIAMPHDPADHLEPNDRLREFIDHLLDLNGNTHKRPSRPGQSTRSLTPTGCR